MGMSARNKGIDRTSAPFCIIELYYKKKVRHKICVIQRVMIVAYYNLRRYTILLWYIVYYPPRLTTVPIKERNVHRLHLQLANT